MRYVIILLLLISVHMLISISIYDNNGYFSVNSIRFKLTPEVNYKTHEFVYHTLSLTQIVNDYRDSCIVDFSSSLLDIKIKIEKTTDYYSKAWLTKVNVYYKQDVYIHDILLKIEFDNQQSLETFMGPKAINSRNTTDNISLCPYTDKVIEFKNSITSFWIAGSNHQQCKNIEWLKPNLICLYDHSLHYARLYRPPTPNERMIDYMPRKNGQKDLWSFVVFEQKPFIISINRWPGAKKAAFALTNDADQEVVNRLTSAFYGSSNPTNPNYLTKGLIANNIKISNTVFSINKPLLNEVWAQIKDFGNTICTHTYSDTSDVSSLTEQSLLSDLSEYNARLWIDHSLPNNKEDFGMFGGFADSPYYILDAINNSTIDYAWIGESPVSNPFNSYTEPWRLPHRVYYFQDLTRPVWFFGRNRMETWEYFSDYNIYGMKYNLTSENLDDLILKNGLCVGYTHFSFTHKIDRLGFYRVLENGDLEIREDVNDALIMLNDYQTNRGLWIDTVETIFDRMLAIEQVNVKSIEDDWAPGFIRVTIENTSTYNIPECSFVFNDVKYNIPMFESNSQYSFLINKSSLDSLVINNPYQLFYKEGYLIIKKSIDEPITKLKAKIYNIKGQLVTKHNTYFEQYYVSIPFKNKASGTYIVEIDSENIKKQTLKFRVIK